MFGGPVTVKTAAVVLIVPFVPVIAHVYDPEFARAAEATV
jgi:hypothetical protein